MNKDLYNDITSKLISLSEDQATPNKIRGLLLSWSNRTQMVDKVSVLCAFYNYMNGRKDFNFINESIEWKEFFKGSFENYFTIEIIKSSFDNIIFDDKLTDLILKFAKENVKKEFYEYAKSQNEISMGTLNTKYKEVFEKLENKCINLGIVEKKIENINISDAPEKQFRTTDEINNEQDKLKQQIALLQLEDEKIEKEREEKRDTIFSSVSNKIGVKKDSLVEKIGEENSYDVDKIVVSDEFMEFITNVDAKAAVVPNGIYKRMLEKISSKRKLKMAELDISLENGVSTLTLSKKDTIFDKIASTSKDILDKIKKSVERKVEMASIIGIVGAEIIKDAVLNTNKEIKTKVENSQKSLKSDMTALGYKAIVGVGNAQIAVEDFIDDAKEKAQLAKQSAASKTAEKLRNFADRIEPASDIVNPAVEITKVDDIKKENYTYINTPKGRAKVVLRAATKAGEVPIKEEVSHSKTAA